MHQFYSEKLRLLGIANKALKGDTDSTNLIQTMYESELQRHKRVQDITKELELLLKEKNDNTETR